ncbi:hypothetical protein MKX01_014174, partial [Papaver californicum]
MLIKINVIGALPRRVLVKYEDEYSWVSVNYNILPCRIYETCRVLDHKMEPCVEGDVIVIEDQVNDVVGRNENEEEGEFIISHVGYSGHEEMSQPEISKDIITEIEIEAPHASIAGDL